MVRPNLNVSAATGHSRMSEPARRRWELEADEAGIRLARAALPGPIKRYEPVVHRNRASKARTSPDGATASYYRLMLAARYAGDRFGVELLMFGPRDFGRRLLATAEIPFRAAMIAEQIADSAEDIAQIRLAFSDPDGPEVWEWIERAEMYRARLSLAIIAAKQYANSKNIHRPVDTRYRKPDALIVAGGVV